MQQHWQWRCCNRETRTQKKFKNLKYEDKKYAKCLSCAKEYKRLAGIHQTYEIILKDFTQHWILKHRAIVPVRQMLRRTIFHPQVAALGRICTCKRIVRLFKKSTIGGEALSIRSAKKCLQGGIAFILWFYEFWQPMMLLIMCYYCGGNTNALFKKWKGIGWNVCYHFFNNTHAINFVPKIGMHWSQTWRL